MTTIDYEIHLDRDQFDSLWHDEAEVFPFGEDLGDIDKVIEEELGTPAKRRRRKPRSQS